MKRTVLFLSILTVMSGCSVHPESPNGKISMETDGLDACIMYEGTKVLDISDLGMTTTATGKGLTFKGIKANGKIVEEYEMIGGKKLLCSNEANEYVLNYKDSEGKPFKAVFRLYNDGVAFRYELTGLKGETVVDETTTYNIPEGTNRWIQRWTEAYEDFFPLQARAEGLSSGAILPSSNLRKEFSLLSAKQAWSAIRVLRASGMMRIWQNTRFVRQRTSVFLMETGLLHGESSSSEVSEMSWNLP